MQSVYSYNAIDVCAVCVVSLLCEMLFNTVHVCMACCVSRCFWLTLVCQRSTLTVTHTTTFLTVMIRIWPVQPDMPVLMLTLAVNRVVVMTSSHLAMSWCISIEDLCHGRVSRSVVHVVIYDGLSVYHQCHRCNLCVTYFFTAWDSGQFPLHPAYFFDWECSSESSLKLWLQYVRYKIPV